MKEELAVSQARSESLEQDNLKKERTIKRNAFHFKNFKKKIEKLEIDNTNTERTKKVKKAEETIKKQQKEIKDTLSKLNKETHKRTKVEAELARVKRMFNDLSHYKYETEAKEMRYTWERNQGSLKEQNKTCQRNSIDQGENHGKNNGWKQRAEYEHWKEDQKTEEERRWRQEEYTRREKEEREKAQKREEDRRRHNEAMRRRRFRDENEEHHEYRRREEQI